MVPTTRYSVIFQKFPSRVRVAQKVPSSIRVAGTRWGLVVGHPHPVGEIGGRSSTSTHRMGVKNSPPPGGWGGSHLQGTKSPLVSWSSHSWCCSIMQPFSSWWKLMSLTQDYVRRRSWCLLIQSPFQSSIWETLTSISVMSAVKTNTLYFRHTWYCRNESIDAWEINLSCGLRNRLYLKKAVVILVP